MRGIKAREETLLDSETKMGDGHRDQYEETGFARIYEWKAKMKKEGVKVHKPTICKSRRGDYRFGAGRALFGSFFTCMLGVPPVDGGGAPMLNEGLAVPPLGAPKVN